MTRHCPEVAACNRGPSHNPWLLRHLINHPEKLPDRVAPQTVVFEAIAKSRLHDTLFRGSHGAMVPTGLLSKGSRLPTLHSRGHDRDMIDTAPFYWNISADSFETFSAKQLAGAGNVFDANESIVIAVAADFLKRCADNS